MGQAGTVGVAAAMNVDTGRRLRVVLLSCDGPYQRDLAVRLHRAQELVGIVKVIDPATRGNLATRLRRIANPARLSRQLLARLDQRRSMRAARPLFDQLFCIDGRAPEDPPGVTVLQVPNVNAAAAVDFVRSCRPDIVCVNGTNLLRDPMLALAPEIPHGIINLHTGLSPYTRGGNCNLYALLEGHPEWVGVTIHHIDAGIDSGDLIRTAQVVMEPDDLFDHIDIRTFRLGNDLLVQAIAEVSQGTAARVRQWQEGRLYLRRTGFVYEPWHWYRVNKMLKKGLVRDYHRNRSTIDTSVRLVGDSR